MSSIVKLEVDVDMADFDDKELIDELESRGYEIGSDEDFESEQLEADFRRLFNLFKTNERAAVSAVKEFLMDQVGGILL